MSAVPLRRDDVSELAFEDVFRQYRLRVIGLARRRFPGLDAEEIAQEVMLRLLTHLDRLDARRDPWPYIATVTVNVGIDMSRAARPTLVLDESSEDACVTAGADDVVLQSELDTRLRDVLSQLPPAGRQVLALHAYDDMSIRQIATFLGCNDNAVRQKLFRARRQFVQVFEQVAAATAAVAAVFGWARRSRAPRPGATIVQASAMTLSSAAFFAAAVVVLPGLVNGNGADAQTTQQSIRMSDVRAASQNDDLPVRRVAVRGTAPSAQVTAPTAAIGPAQAHIAQPGDLWRKGQTNSIKVAVETPVGSVALEVKGVNSEGYGAVCRLGPVACS